MNFQMVEDNYCHMNNKWLEYKYYVSEKIDTFGYNILDELFTKLPHWLRVFVVVESILPLHPPPFHPHQLKWLIQFD